MSLSSEPQRFELGANDLKSEYVEFRTKASPIRFYAVLQIAEDIEQIPDSIFGMIFVYDVTAEESFSVLEQAAKALDARTQKNPAYSPVRILVGTHKDRNSVHKIPYGRIQQLKQKHNMLWVEVGKEQNVHLLFKQLAVQSIFCARAQPDVPLVPRSLFF